MKKIITLIIAASLLSGCSAIDRLGIREEETPANIESEKVDVWNTIEYSEKFSLNVDSKDLTTISSYKYNEDYLYFINDQDNICKLDYNNGDVVQIPSEKAKDLFLVEDKLLYKNEANEVVCIDLQDEKELGKLSLNIDFQSVVSIGEDLYYIADNELKKMNLNDNKEQNVFSFDSMNIKVEKLLGTKFNKIFYEYNSEDDVVLGYYDLETNNWINLTSISQKEKPEKYFTIEDNYVYFISEDSVFTLYKIDEEGIITEEYIGYDIQNHGVDNSKYFVMESSENYNKLYITNDGNKLLVDEMVVEAELTPDEIYYIKVVEKEGATNWMVWKANIDGGNKCPILNFGEEIIDGIEVTNGEIYVAVSGNIDVYSKFQDPLLQITNFEGALDKTGEWITFKGYGNHRKTFSPIYLSNPNIAKANNQATNNNEDNNNQMDVQADTQDNTVNNVQEDTQDNTDNNVQEDIPENTQEDKQDDTDNNTKDSTQVNTENTNTESSDYATLYSLIKKFDKEWENFVNEKPDEVEKYITKDSAVHSFMSKFDAENISEEFLEIEVQEVKVDGNRAEVYVYEKIKKTIEGQENIVEYNWIYHVKKVNGDWLVHTYEKND